MIHKYKFPTVETLRHFLFLGDIFVTVRSLKTGRHFTFRVAKPTRNFYSLKRDKIYFVSVISEGNKPLYLGMIKNYKYFSVTRASKFSRKSPQFIAFKYMLAVTMLKSYIPSKLEVWHDGKCGVCGHHITHPESLRRGIGPICYKKMKIMSIS